jgi:hypothetical protein
MDNILFHQQLKYQMQIYLFQATQKQMNLTDDSARNFHYFRYQVSLLL